MPKGNIAGGQEMITCTDHYVDSFQSTGYAYCLEAISLYYVFSMSINTCLCSSIQVIIRVMNVILQHIIPCLMHLLTVVGSLKMNQVTSYHVSYMF